MAGAALFGADKAPFGRTRSRPGAGRLPVIILTGFLGAGKSTLIREMLKTAAGRNTALIVNEFGAVGIDDALLRAGSEKTVLLGNGCLCCVSQTDLQLTMSSLFSERAAGRVPNFERIIIETSGLADPIPLLQTLASNRTIATHFALSTMICVVDCALAPVTSDRCPEWSKQIALADRVILTKSELVDGSEREGVVQLIRRQNQHAPIMSANFGRIDPEFIFAAPLASERTGRMLCEATLGPDAEHARPYSSFVVILDKPISWSAFDRALEVLADLRGPDLLRVKGIVNVAGREGPVVVHLVQHLAHPPEELLAWPDADRRTRLVFITRGLEESRVSELLRAVIAMEN